MKKNIYDKNKFLSIIKYNKETKHLYLGLFFLLIQILAIYRNTSSNFFSFFWYCDFASGFFAIFFLTKNIRAVNGLLNIGLFPQLGFVFIMLTKLILNITLFNFTFDFPLTPYFIITTIFIHLTTLFVIINTYKIKPKIQDLYYSTLFLIMIYSVVIIFTPVSANYNYIFTTKSLGFITHYTDLWILLTFILLVIPTQIFRQLIYKIYIRIRIK